MNTMYISKEPAGARWCKSQENVLLAYHEAVHKATKMEAVRDCLQQVPSKCTDRVDELVSEANTFSQLLQVKISWLVPA